VLQSIQMQPCSDAVWSGVPGTADTGDYGADGSGWSQELSASTPSLRRGVKLLTQILRCHEHRHATVDSAILDHLASVWELIW